MFYFVGGHRFTWLAFVLLFSGVVFVGLGFVFLFTGVRPESFAGAVVWESLVFGGPRTPPGEFRPRLTQARAGLFARKNPVFGLQGPAGEFSGDLWVEIPRGLGPHGPA